MQRTNAWTDARRNSLIAAVIVNVKPQFGLVYSVGTRDKKSRHEFEGAVHQFIPKINHFDTLKGNAQSCWRELWPSSEEGNTLTWG